MVYTTMELGTNYSNNKRKIMSRTIDIKVLEEVLLNTIKTLEERYKKLPFDNIEDWEEKWRLDERIRSYYDVIQVLPETIKNKN